MLLIPKLRAAFLKFKLASTYSTELDRRDITNFGDLCWEFPAYHLHFKLFAHKKSNVLLQIPINFIHTFEFFQLSIERI